MIGKLKGLVDTRSLERCIIDVGGVGYLVHISAKTLDALPQEGEATTLYIETHVREDHIHLYGFATTLEQEWFTILTTVKGVGTRMALAILSTFSGNELSQIFAAQDHKTLTAVSGVGPKLALRLTTELKDKQATSLDIGITTSSNVTAITENTPSANSKINDAVSALTNLGYPRNQAFSTVSTLIAQDSTITVEDLIRYSLKELAA